MPKMRFPCPRCDKRELSILAVYEDGSKSCECLECGAKYDFLKEDKSESEVNDG